MALGRPGYVSLWTLSLLCFSITLKILSLSLMNVIATTTASLHLAGLSSAFFFSRKCFQNCLFAHLTHKTFPLFIQLYHPSTTNTIFTYISMKTAKSELQFV